MSITKENAAILDKFDFDLPPVGVKFLSDPPDTIEPIGGKLALCEMLKRAQQGHTFYAGAQNHACEAGLYVLGQEDAPEPFINGAFGAGLQIYEAQRAASRLYLHIPRIGKGVVHYLAFAPLDKMNFDPDVLILIADTDQTEILLRALSYKTGQMWVSKFTPAIGCAWIYVYPFLSGELNYSIAGLGHGMRRRELFPRGRQIISIPFDLLPSMLQTLQEMPWELPAFKPDGLEFVKNLLGRLRMPVP